VWFVDTLDSILVLAGTLRQFLGDNINTAGGVAADWGQELYSLADVKFMGMHGVSAPTRERVYHTRGDRVLGHHGGGGGRRIASGIGAPEASVIAAIGVLVIKIVLH
jgi:hypothetical protein